MCVIAQRAPCTAALTRTRCADGNSQRGQHITPGAVLVFKLELIKLLGPGQKQPAEL
jgi:hypothetical protein